jgi:ATP-dependent Lhr-like helicase
MASAGRWSILQQKPVSAEFSALEAAEDAERIARLLLKRYGVVFKRLLEREGIQLPWRVLLRVYHRLEARGEIRGGRFVAGISGEQFALPEAIGMMRAIRRARTGIKEAGQALEVMGDSSPTESLISISAADPLNLAGIITPGSRITAHTSNRVLYHNGEPIAVLEAGATKFLSELSRTMEWKAKAALLRKAIPPPLRSYLRRPA